MDSPMRAVPVDLYRNDEKQILRCAQKDSSFTDDYAGCFELDRYCAAPTGTLCGAAMLTRDTSVFTFRSTNSCFAFARTVNPSSY